MNGGYNLRGSEIAAHRSDVHKTESLTNGFWYTSSAVAISQVTKYSISSMDFSGDMLTVKTSGRWRRLFISRSSRDESMT